MAPRAVLTSRGERRHERPPEKLFIKARDFIHAGEASIRIQHLLKTMQFDPHLVRRIAVCSYEGEMNVVMHGGDGSLCMELDRDVLWLDISDEGPGIPDIELAMRPGYSTARTNSAKWGSVRAWACRT